MAMKSIDEMNTNLPEQVGTGSAAPRSPDLLGSLSQVMQLQNLASQVPLHQLMLQQANMQYGDQMDTRSALANNTNQDPLTGQSSVNMAGALSDLTRDNPRAAMQLQQGLLQQQEEAANLQKTKLGNFESQANLAGRIAGSIALNPTQESLDTGLQTAQRMGLDVSKFPTDVTDPTFMDRLKQAQDIGRTAQDQASTVMDQQKLNQTMTNDLRGKALDVQKEVATNPATIEFQRIGSVLNQANEAYKQSTTLASSGGSDAEVGASDKALGVSFGIMENPRRSPTSNSIITTEEARSVPANILGFANSAINGGTLTQAQRDQMINFMSNRVEAQRTQYAAGVEGPAIQQVRALGIPREAASLGDDQLISNNDVTPNAYLNDKAASSQNTTPTAAPTPLEKADQQASSTKNDVYALPESKIIAIGKTQGLSPEASIRKWIAAGHQVVSESNGN